MARTKNSSSITSKSSARKTVSRKVPISKKSVKSGTSTAKKAKVVASPKKEKLKSAKPAKSRTVTAAKGLKAGKSTVSSKSSKGKKSPAKVTVSAGKQLSSSRSAVVKPNVKSVTAQKKSSKAVEVSGSLPSKSSIVSGKKSSVVVKSPPAHQEKNLQQDSLHMTKKSSSTNGTGLNGSVEKTEVEPILAAQILVEQSPEVPVKRKRGRPRKSESLNGNGTQKLKETKGVRRFGMNYGRPGVAAGRYSWSAETGTSTSGSEGQLDDVDSSVKSDSLAQEIEVEFSQSDKVVYPAHGLGIIEAIQIRTVGGTQQKFYMISIVETGMKIMVPVGQSKTVGLRRVVDPTTVDRVYDILRDKDIEIDNQTWNRRYREYSQKIKTGSVLEIASVIRDLTVLKIEKELSFNERRMLDTAQGLLVKELSIAKSSSEDSIKEELELICQP